MNRVTMSQQTAGSIDFSLEYLYTGSEFRYGRPVQAAKNMMLLIDAVPRTCKQAAECGWSVHNLIFSEALFALNANQSYTVIKADYNSEWVAKISQKFDLVYAADSVGYAPQLSLFIKKLHSLLKSQGRIFFRVQNSSYYQRLIDQSTRELLPWPGHAPQGLSYTRGEIETGIRDTECAIMSVLEEFDSLFYDTNYTRWQHVNGIDCRIALPVQPEERKSYFIKNFSVELINASPEIITAANMVEGIDIEQVHRQIQTLLSDGQTGVVRGMLDKIFSANRQTDMSYNLLGIYYFYSKEYKNAYTNFIEAIEHNASVADYYLNLYDAAKNLGIESEVITLAKAAAAQYPALHAVVQELAS